MEFTLQKGANRAVVETKGGELVSFRDGAGTEYIWGGDPAYWSGRNPLLFPIVGNLKDGKVNIKDRTFSMARHGFARRCEFEAVERGEDFVVFELRESPATLEQYPYPFVLRVRHQLTQDGFDTRFEVENPGEEELPFCIGAHTAFRCPLFEGENFEDYQLVFDQAEDAPSFVPTAEGLLSHTKTGPALDHTNVISLRHETFDRLDTLIFRGLRSHGVCLRNQNSGRGVRMEFEGFPMIAFWTMPHASAPYICLEPWHGCAAYEDESGAFTDKPHCVTLVPGAMKQLHYTVSILSE